MANSARNTYLRSVYHHRSRVILSLLLTLTIGGCKRDSTGESQSEGTNRPVVGVTLLNVQHRFYQDLREGLKNEAEKHGFKLIVTTAEHDAARQSNQIDEFIVQSVDAMVVCPCDSRSIGSSILEANEAGIPVFTADIANSSSRGKVVCHIASDNTQGGRKAAQLLADAIGGKGKVAIISHPEVSSVMDRVEGFRQEIARFPGIEIAADLSSEGKREKAARVMEDLLQSHPDIVGVFAINDDSALGALASVEAAGKLGNIAIVGYDATPEARAKIATGAISGDVIQNPTQIGELTIQAIADHLAGKSVPAVIPVDVGTFTRSDADSEHD